MLLCVLGIIRRLCELGLSDRLGVNDLGPLERLFKSISEPLYFDLSEPRQLFKPFFRGVGDVSEALARSLVNLQP
jgi:hypothetical protein